MKDWLLGIIVKWILDQVANGGAENLVERLRKIVVPWVRHYKEELVTRLKKEAAETATPLDDAVIKALDSVLEAIIPSA